MNSPPTLADSSSVPAWGRLWQAQWEQQVEGWKDGKDTSALPSPVRTSEEFKPSESEALGYCVLKYFSSLFSSSPVSRIPVVVLATYTTGNWGFVLPTPPWLLFSPFFTLDHLYCYRFTSTDSSGNLHLLLSPYSMNFLFQILYFSVLEFQFFKI